MLRRNYQESFKIAEYLLHQLSLLGRLEIHIALSNPFNIDVRILVLCYIVLPSLVYLDSLDIEYMKYAKPCKQARKLNNLMILLLFGVQ